MDPQIYLPRRLYPGLVGNRREAERHRLIVSDVETLRYHYAYTLEEWYRRTVAAREEIVELYDERFFRMWQFYLAGAEAAFRYGGLANFQVQYLSAATPSPITRDYMFEEEQRLRGLEQPPKWHLGQAAE